MRRDDVEGGSKKKLPTHTKRFLEEASLWVMKATFLRHNEIKRWKDRFACGYIKNRGWVLVHRSWTGVRSITRRILSRGLPVSTVLVPRTLKRCTLEGRSCFEGAASRQPRLLHRYLPPSFSPLQFYCLFLPLFQRWSSKPGSDRYRRHQ